MNLLVPVLIKAKAKLTLKQLKAIYFILIKMNQQLFF